MLGRRCVRRAWLRSYRNLCWRGWRRRSWGGAGGLCSHNDQVREHTGKWCKCGGVQLTEIWTVSLMSCMSCRTHELHKRGSEATAWVSAVEVKTAGSCTLAHGKLPSHEPMTVRPMHAGLGVGEGEYPSRCMYGSVVCMECVAPELWRIVWTLRRKKEY